LISNRSPERKVIYLMVTGMASAVAGYIWGLTFPVNENLWTSSFVLVTSGMAAMVLGAAYYTVDIRGITWGTGPGIIFGANAITVYVLADILALIFYRLPLAGHPLNFHAVSSLHSMGMSQELAGMFYSLFFVFVNFIPAFILYRKRIFIKL
jgi:predicted acyltransferase